jgi:hypothetical protein
MTYGLDQAPAAVARMLGHHASGKVAIAGYTGASS